MSFGSGTALADTSGDGSVLGGNQVNLPVSIPIDISGTAAAVGGHSNASSQGGTSVENHGIPGRTSGNGSVLGGNQINAPISAPVNACGVSAAVVGKATAGCKGGATVRNSGKGGNLTSGDGSVLGGNQINAPVSAPVNVCGNAAAIFGAATAGCKGGASVANPSSGGNVTSGRGSVLGGNQILAPISAPINVCGNAVAVVGTAFAGCKGGASVHNGGGAHGYMHHPWHSAGNDTDGRSGVISGNQIISGVSAPISVCGTAVAVVGKAFAGCKGGAEVRQGTGRNTTSGKSGVLAGNQILAPVSVPASVCGVAVAVVGKANARCKGGATVTPPAGGNTTSGKGGVLAGNQILAPISAPINVCGNAVAVLGDAAAGCLGGSRVGKPVPDGYGHYGYHASSKHSPKKESGVLPALPALPVLGSLQGVSGATQQMRGGATEGLPLVDELSRTFGLPALPELPGMSNLPGVPGVAEVNGVPGLTDVTPVPVKKPLYGKPPVAKNQAGPLDPATSLVGSTPVGGAVKSTAGGLPTGDLGLMSAAQPAGVTGMNNGSLFALVLGAMAAASATLFATTRRFRLGRK
ncbi:chaplin family protein [Nonomuraea rhizosphaerae]|uniref:chaplin family protein n=1 Tax=Nonomuraea rhizosphaerae TaxID=2665663 RepID=UPI001C5D0091|nr:chaplin family protein [Nonomuraea rhizosphaerae]